MGDAVIFIGLCGLSGAFGMLVLALAVIYVGLEVLFFALSSGPGSLLSLKILWHFLRIVVFNASVLPPTPLSDCLNK